MHPILKMVLGAALCVLLISPVLCAVLYRKVHALQKALVEEMRNQQASSVIITEMHRALDEETRKKNDYFRVITDFEKESLRWRDLYWKQSREHGNAQQRLMMEREHNFRLLRANKIRPYTDPVIAQLVGAFLEEHDEPARLAEISNHLGVVASDPAALDSPCSETRST